MALPTAVVLLHLMVWDADTGKLLEKLQPDIAGSFSISGARLEDCRLFGLEKGKALTAKWRVTYPNAFTNVDCEWDRSGQPA
jgi:hypothetical protein